MQRNGLLFVAAIALAALLGCSETKVEPRAELLPSTVLLRGQVVGQGPLPDEPPVAPPAEPIAALGGSCLSVAYEAADGIRYGELTSEASRAERRQDYIAAVDLAKQIVLADCANWYWWRKLAELQLKVDRAAGAVATLSEYHDRGGNDVDPWLHDSEGQLRELLNSDAFKRSTLAQELAAEREAVDQRRRAAGDKLASIERPPEYYVADNACPFECCMYGEWTALEPKTLYRAPESAEAIGAVEANQTVEALGGEMRLRPTPVLVRFAGVEGLTAKAGDIVFLLDYSGESFGNVWVDGEVQSASGFGARENCPSPNQECWGEVLRPEDAGNWRNGVWWIEIKTKDGTIGWTSEADHFTGADACG
ncbi:MAG: hypothetical protein O3A53_06235 [Acidobacteria bacterium]|nr:hypothetical protein [Acidobacteriota bacterium]